MYKRILVPLDGSVIAEQAIPHAIGLAKLSDAKVVLLRVIEPFPPVRSMSPADMRTIKKHAKEWAKDYFEKITKKLKGEGISTKTIISEGRAGVKITKYAEENDIDLILLCSRGRTGLTRWLMGSVADRILRGTTIPVLLVPAIVDNPA